VINLAIPKVFDAQWRRLKPFTDASRARLMEDLLRFADIIDETPADLSIRS
jgi:hypothetical protein